MINDVASKERERNRLEMVQNERNGKQSKKKWERERDLGPGWGYPITPCDKQEMRPDISR